MQKLLFVLAVSAFVLSSCGTKKAEHKEGAHVHEDGTVHEAHENEAPAQEAFEAKEEHTVKDSCDMDKKEESEAHKHDHDAESGHDHDHDHNH